MGHQVEQGSFDSAPREREQNAGPQVTLEFASGSLMVLRPGARPERWPIRSNAVTMRLLEALLTVDDAPRDLRDPSSAWVAKDELIKRVINPESIDRNDSFKKALRAVRKFLAANDLGTVQATGDGQYRIDAPDGIAFDVRLRG